MVCRGCVGIPATTTSKPARLCWPANKSPAISGATKCLQSPLHSPQELPSVGFGKDKQSFAGCLWVLSELCCILRVTTYGSQSNIRFWIGISRRGQCQVLATIKPPADRRFCPYGYGSNLKHQGTAGFRPWFHLLGFQNENFNFLTTTAIFQTFFLFFPHSTGRGC